ncbi:PREDICTED: uncharacterized protein LOC108548662 [Eufriesea mexicana]|uniref:uncharacterized protein LOC108548662 n=1 Tax=Eufriesea mexicana TaxID=516756 RepID=UPI00083BFDFE|nr:PREDICTED: uncharacterized protein LOC108548662 [Eufriesea mexicana]XP_017757212.1 PREDICTED: uncharacterized protein LOC108548662 [Eufriesea mexicana]
MIDCCISCPWTSKRSFDQTCFQTFFMTLSFIWCLDVRNQRHRCRATWLLKNNRRIDSIGNFTSKKSAIQLHKEKEIRKTELFENAINRYLIRETDHEPTQSQCFSTAESIEVLTKCIIAIK